MAFIFWGTRSSCNTDHEPLGESEQAQNSRQQLALLEFFVWGRLPDCHTNLIAKQDRHTNQTCTAGSSSKRPVWSLLPAHLTAKGRKIACRCSGLALQPLHGKC